MSYRALIQIRDHINDDEMFFVANLDDTFRNVEAVIEHAIKLNGNPRDNKAFTYIATICEERGFSGRAFYSPSESDSWREQWADQHWLVYINSEATDCLTIKAECYDAKNHLEFFRRVEYYTGV